MKIKDICTSITDGSHNPPQGVDYSCYLMLSSKNIFDDEITTDEPRYLTESDFAIENKRTKIVSGDVLLTIVGTVGRSAVVPENAPKFTLQRSVAVLHPNSDICLSRYLMYALRAKRSFIENRAKGVAQKGIYLGEVSNIDLHILSLTQQKSVVQTLDFVVQIIKNHECQLQSFDNLIKARFVEMFGDPEINPFCWNKVGISSVTNGKASNGYFAKREDYVEEGNVAVLGVAYVVNRMYSQVEGLPRTNATESDIQKHRLKYGDMLFCRSSLVAEGIGKASIVPESVPDNTLFECHVIRIPLNLEKCVPEFMQVLSTTAYFRKQIISQSKTATMTTIGQDGVLKTEIILPPIEKQREFYSFVKQIDKSKYVVQHALDKAQLLLDSLMQKYFG